MTINLCINDISLKLTPESGFTSAKATLKRFLDLTSKFLFSLYIEAPLSKLKTKRSFSFLEEIFNIIFIKFLNKSNLCIFAFFGSVSIFS